MDHLAHLRTVIRDQQDSIRAHLGDEQRALLDAALRRLADAAGDFPAAMRAMHDIRLALGPLPAGHPVWQALNALLSSYTDSAMPRGPVPATGAVLTRPSEGEQGTDSSLDGELGDEKTLNLRPPRALGRAGPPVPPTGVWAEERLTEPMAVPEPDPVAAAIVATVQRRLLRAPSLSAEEARDRCAGGPPPRELIRLDDPVRGTRYPAFQFALGPGGAPIPVVRQVNRTLLAHIDPWGAADWWLSGNTWLGGPPVSFLGVLPDEALAGVARALVDGD
ncbi:hypothetical protein [Streptomyces sp. UNOC14_S4]|uniref:hypothetical protein n=1 Tax=Streptomyces sp. UNOC14_S4 TaxID=2872340 RepID=UPI001E5D0ACB|nr:hypothetical protein [Streptomyces sp. UNOC14_S4]MCC3767463.1 hypothetical protein [Streptomyces sp. UNOC14_S4]